MAGLNANGDAIIRRGDVLSEKLKNFGTLGQK